MPVHDEIPAAALRLARLTEKERQTSLAIARDAESDWRPFLLNAHAEAGQNVGLDGHWRGAIDALLTAAEDHSRPHHERLNSAFLALRRTHAAPMLDAPDLRARLVAAVRQPPFRDHRVLQREIRRLGVNAVSSRP